ncbi:hypothetical protein FANTH_13745 [Fusarium anthophilum]|uniref:SET domain-containing protein n=1 Tax=Fusarium anthophilum TaxID=48485 RepID=A0A8H4YML0_9HYPO|nr:hypothetical protein FANTH_13745 [Fusarium anthophilum]
MLESTENSIFTLWDIHGKGKGLVATSNIHKGTRILSEEPVIRVPEDALDSPVLRASIPRQVDQLTSDRRQAFLSMCNVYPGDTASQYLGIIRTNALPIDIRGKAWNDNIGRHTIHALRDIEKGEEITITYIGVLNNRRSRQEVFRKKFMFTCVCRLCSLPEHLSAESDTRLDEILRLDSCIGREGLRGIQSDPKRMLGYVDRQVRLYNEQGPDDVGLPKAFFDAAQICAAHGDLARARVFTERAAAGWLGLGSNEFEDWLWKREKDCKLEEQGLFRNQATFPSFIQLPNETDVDDNFFKTRDGVNYQPQRHWCFLAEITDYLTLVRLQMEVKDVAGKRIPILFYTDGRGSEIAPSQLFEGCAFLCNLVFAPCNNLPLTRGRSVVSSRPLQLLCKSRHEQPAGTACTLGIAWSKGTFVPLPGAPLSVPICKSSLSLGTKLQAKVERLKHLKNFATFPFHFILGATAAATSENITGGAASVDDISEPYNALDGIYIDWVIKTIAFASNGGKLTGLKTTYTNGQEVIHGNFSRKVWKCDVEPPLIVAKLTARRTSEGGLGFLDAVEFIRADPASKKGEQAAWPLDVSTLPYLGEGDMRVTVDVGQVVERAPNFGGNARWICRGFYGKTKDRSISRLGIVWGRG